MPRFFDNPIDDFMGLNFDDRHSGHRSRSSNPRTFYEPDAYMFGALSPNIEINDRRRRHHRMRHDDFFGDDEDYYLNPRWYDHSISAVEPERHRRRSGWCDLFESRRDRGGFAFDDFGGLDDSGFGFDHGHGHGRHRSLRRNRGHDMYFPDVPSIPEIPRVPDIPDIPDVPGVLFHHFDMPCRQSRPRRPRDDWYDVPGTHRTYRTCPGDQGVSLINEHHTGPFGERSRGERSE
jgi:hypothetical protein